MRYLLFLLISLPYVVFAGEPDEIKIKDFLARFEADINQNNNLISENYFHPHVSMTLQNGASISSIEVVTQFFKQLTEKGKPALVAYQVKILPPTSYQQQGNFWVVQGKALDHYTFSDGLVFDLETSWSALLIPVDQSFQVFALHLSANLFDNPILKSANKVQGTAGSVGFFLGLVAAWILFRVVRRQLDY